LTVPVAAESAERSFSKLKLVKIICDLQYYVTNSTCGPSKIKYWVQHCQTNWFL